MNAERLWISGCALAAGAVMWSVSCGPTSEQPQKKAANAPTAPKAASPGSSAPLAAAPTGKSGEGEKQEEPAGPVGWYGVVAGGGETAKVSAASAAFALGEGKSLHPAVPADGQVVSYSGNVQIENPGRYRFAARMQGGMAKLSVMRGASSVGEGALTPDQSAVHTNFVDLPAGNVTVNVVFTRIGAGSATLRTMWEKEGAGEKGFREESIPPNSVHVAKFAVSEVETAQSAMRGRTLLGVLNCVSCHKAWADAVTPRQAPLMGEIARRVSPEWLAKWVRDPQSMKPGCGMPTVFTPLDDADADATVHYLMSLGSVPEWEAPANETRFLDDGKKLYHTVGCVTCHGVLDDPSKIFSDAGVRTATTPTNPPAPFGKISGKWRPAGLSEFLKDPLRTHPGGRMPSMSLNASEADLIANYLVNNWDAGGFKPGEFKSDAAKVEKGRAVFAARGCASCHQTGHNLPDIASTLTAKPLAEVDAAKGCMEPKGAGPRYMLSDQDRSDLAAGIAEVKRIKTPSPAPIDHAQRLIGAMGCLHCHQKDEAGGIADDLKVCFRTTDETELGDEGRFPPRITGVGTKLTTNWLKKVLTDGGRARPYMATRMPQYGAKNVGELAEQLGAIDGLMPDGDATWPQPTDGLVLAGRKLVGDKGMNCISCHAYGGKAAGTQGPDITGFAQRLRYEWWKPYLMAPARFKPGTRMSAFYATGKGAVTDVFAGDPDRQADALWAYFSTTGGPAPEGLPSAAGLPLIVGDAPVVFRTFLKDAGSRGIAVGYPIGTHFGFDGNGVRLASAWKGEFVDATSAWKGRGGMVATGQGKSIWIAPAGPSIIVGERPATWPDKGGSTAGYRFHGYRVGERGIPVFMYSVGEVSVEEVFKPVDSGQIKRTFTVKNVPAGATVWLNTGPGVVSSNAIANIASDRAAGDGKVKLEAYTAKDAGQPMSFSVVIKP